MQVTNGLIELIHTEILVENLLIGREDSSPWLILLASIVPRPLRHGIDRHGDQKANLGDVDNAKVCSPRIRYRVANVRGCPVE